MWPRCPLNHLCRDPLMEFFKFLLVTHCPGVCHMPFLNTAELLRCFEEVMRYLAPCYLLVAVFLRNRSATSVFFNFSQFTQGVFWSILCLAFFPFVKKVQHTGLWSDRVRSSSFPILLMRLCLSPGLLMKPSSSYHLLCICLYHVQRAWNG